MTIHSAAAPRLRQQLEALGLPAEELFAAAGLDGVHLRGEARAPRVAFLQVKAEASRRLRDPCLGFRLGASTDVATFESYGAALSHAGTLGEALALGRRFLPVWEEGNSVHLEERPGAVRLVYRNQGASPLADSIDSQQSVVFIGALASRLLGTRFPITLGCAGPRPRHDACLRAAEAAGCALRFRAEAWYLELPQEAMAAPLPGAHPAVGKLLRRELEREFVALGAGDDLRGRLREALRKGLGLGWGTAQVAVALRTPLRTLQAQLAAQGTSLRQERDAVRLELAEALLGDGELSIEEVARRVGFDSLPGFSRFFRRSTGRPPSVHRGRRGQR